MFSQMFFSVPVWVAMIKKLRKILTFLNRALKWAFVNRNYKLFLCASSSSPICYTIINRQLIFLSKVFKVLPVFLSNIILCNPVIYHFALIDILASKPWIISNDVSEKEFFSVACSNANNLSKMRLVIRDQPPTVKSDSTNYFQQRTTFLLQWTSINPWLEIVTVITVFQFDLITTCEFYI